MVKNPYLEKSFLFVEISNSESVDSVYTRDLVAMLSQENSELSSSAVLPIGQFESIYSSRLDIQRHILRNEDEAYMHAFEALMNQVSDVKLSAKEISIVQVKAEREGYLIFIADARSVLGALPIL